MSLGAIALQAAQAPWRSYHCPARSSKQARPWTHAPMIRTSNFRRRLKLSSLHGIPSARIKFPVLQGGN